MNRRFFAMIAIMMASILNCLAQLDDPETGKRLIQEAENGNVESQFRLSNCYQYGWYGLSKDNQLRLKWLKKAAEQGHAEAQYNYGDLFKYGEGKDYGLQDDNNEYLKWMHKAAEGGYRSAMFSLGLYYEKINRNKAIYWYSKDLDTYYARNSKIDETDLSYKHLVEMGVDYSPQSNRHRNFNEDFNYNDNNINSPNSNNANINNNSPKEDCTASSSATTAPSNVNKNVAPQKRTIRRNVPVRTNRINKTRVKVRR